MSDVHLPPPFGRLAAANDASVRPPAEERASRQFLKLRKMQFQAAAILLLLFGATLAARPSQAAVTISSFSCASSSFKGAGTDTCTVSMSGVVKAANGRNMKLSSNNPAVQVPSSLLLPRGTTSITFT